MRGFTISLSTKGSQITKRFVKSLRVSHLKKKRRLGGVSELLSIRTERRRPVTTAPGSTAACSVPWRSGRLEEMTEQTVPETLLTQLPTVFHLVWILYSYLFPGICRRYACASSSLHVKAEREREAAWISIQSAATGSFFFFFLFLHSRLMSMDRCL